MLLPQNEYASSISGFWHVTGISFANKRHGSANAYLKGQFQVDSLSIHMSELSAWCYYNITVSSFLLNFLFSMNLQHNKIFHKDFSQKSFCTGRKFPLSLGARKEDRVSSNQSSNLVIFYLGLVTKKCLITLPQLTNVIFVHSTLQDFLKSVQVPSKLFFSFFCT